MSAILSFLGGSAFRMIWGEFSTWMNRKQEHKIELQRLELQGKLDADAHARNLEALRVQAELGVKTIQVQADADMARADSDAFRAAMAEANKPSGVKWIDGANAFVRPLGAYIAYTLWAAYEHQGGWVLTSFTMELMCVILGFFFADRTLGKRKR